MSDLRHIDDCLATVLPEIDQRFAERAYWSTLRRNSAITARNRAMREISAMLDMPFNELPLEKPEAA
jgi:hypothetical protein